MSVVLTLVVLYLSFSMFFIRREYKIICLLVKLICFSTFNPAFPLLLFQFPVVCFFLSELRFFKSIRKKIKDSGFLSFFIIAVISSLIAIVFSPHLHKFSEGCKFFYSEVVACYGLVLAGYLAVFSLKDVKFVFKSILYLSIILSFWAIFCLIMQKALWAEWISGESNLFRTDRLRLNSMFVNAFDYGFYSVVLFLFSFYAYEYKILKKVHCIIIFVCCLFGALCCGSRTVLLCLIISTLYYLLFNLKLKSKLLMGLVATFGFFCVAVIYPEIFDAFSFLTSLFSSNSKVEGSSFEMRQTQLESVLFYVAKNPLFGNGIGYFNIDLGWADYDSTTQSLVDPELEGLESIVFSYLLERGFVGLLLYGILCLILLYQIIKRRRTDKCLADCLISIFIAYHLYSIATGVLLSPFITLFFIGVGLRIIDLRKMLNYGCVGNNSKLQYM